MTQEEEESVQQARRSYQEEEEEEKVVVAACWLFGCSVVRIRLTNRILIAGDPLVR